MRFVSRVLAAAVAVFCVCRVTVASPVLSLSDPPGSVYNLNAGRTLILAAGLPVTITMTSSVPVNGSLQINLTCANGLAGFIFAPSTVFTFAHASQSASIEMMPPRVWVDYQQCTGVLLSGGDPAFNSSSMYLPVWSFGVDSQPTFGKPYPGGYVLYFSLTEGDQRDKHPNTPIAVGQAFEIGWRSYYDSHLNYLGACSGCDNNFDNSMNLAVSCRLNDEVAFSNLSLSLARFQAGESTVIQYNTPLRGGTVRCAFKWLPSSVDQRYSIVTFADLLIPIVVPTLRLQGVAIVNGSGSAEASFNLTVFSGEASSAVRIVAALPGVWSAPILIRDGSSVNVSVDCTGGVLLVDLATALPLTWLLLSNANGAAANFSVRAPILSADAQPMSALCSFVLLLDDHSANTSLTPDVRYTHTVMPALTVIVTAAPPMPPPSSTAVEPASSSSSSSSTGGPRINNAAAHTSGASTVAAALIATMAVNALQANW